MSAVKSRPFQELFELVSIRSLNDLLERYKIGGDSSKLAVEETDATSIPCGVPHVDCKDA
jgi:hypothetical protein